MVKKPINYKDSGVNIDAGNRLVEKIKPLAKSTARSGVISGIGGFGGLFELPLHRYKHPILVSSTDGVGTKLKLAFDSNIHHSIGIDLVAMCANDIVVSGAEPLFFLDYYATGKLNVEQAATVIAGITEGCKQAGCGLIGGESAEMPGMYQTEEYDLAGFCVGIVEKNKIIDLNKVKPGDKIIALGSSGLHSNGYSLLRKILLDNQIPLNTPFTKGQSLSEILLQPTKIYVKSILNLLEQFDIHAIAHITGGGLTENIPRVLPHNTTAVIDLKTWEMPEIFQWLAQQGNIEVTEMLRTFNCGVGMVIIVDADDNQSILEYLQTTEEHAWEIGTIEAVNTHQPCVSYVNE